MSKQIPDIQRDFSEWYNFVIYEAELVDQSPVRGCMVIRPYGQAIWELIKARLDLRIKETGHENATFPLFIPQSFLTKEAHHVEGFAPELAVVTHAGGKELEEPLVVRPTSETIIHHMFARWIRSWRDLPLKINQWANVVRWEMRTRPFLRTTEFLWQEGHTAHETAEEARAEALLMLREYIDLAENYLAIPVIAGRKTEQEKFPGAERTYTFEGIMPDGKALQMGTSHVISQSFAHAFEMKFQDRQGAESYPHLTSWGATTRLVGALIMTHGDQKGLVIPPRVAPIQVVIVPITKANTDTDSVMRLAEQVKIDLHNAGIRVHLDTRDSMTPGAKFYQWELKGIPIRIEIGPRDAGRKEVITVERVQGIKTAVAAHDTVSVIATMLKDIQRMLFERAQARRTALWCTGKKLVDFGPELETGNVFYQTGWCGNATCENSLKPYKASTRCILEERTANSCFFCEKPSIADVIVAKSY